MEKDQKRLIFFMPSMEGGGVEKNLILIANYISKYKKKVCLITFDDSFNKYFDKKILIINARKKNSLRFSKYYKYLFCTYLLIKEYFKNNNILLFSFQANIYIIILSFFLKFKIISRSNSSPSGWNKNFFKNLVFKYFFKKADCIIVNSKQFQLEFKKKFNIKTQLIYNPLNEHEIIKKSAINLKKDTFEKNKLKIINIARLTDQKDHLTLIKALNIVKKDIQFNLIIIGYGINKSLIQKKIKNFNLEKSVKILGYKSNPYPYLRASDLFILTSKYEGLPNVILEAQVLKKYVISSDCPTGPKEILLNGKTGTLFKVGDYKQLAIEIKNFYYNRNKMRKKIKIAFQMLHRFDFKKNCNRYLFLVNKYI